MKKKIVNMTKLHPSDKENKKVKCVTSKTSNTNWWVVCVFFCSCIGDMGYGCDFFANIN